LALGRATPGLRTLTVIAAAVSGLNGRRALPALILGSSVFLQLHLVLGMLFGPLADRAFDRAKGPALVAAAVLVIGTVVFWRGRRRRGGAGPRPPVPGGRAARPGGGPVPRGVPAGGVGGGGCTGGGGASRAGSGPAAEPLL